MPTPHLLHRFTVCDPKRTQHPRVAAAFATFLYCAAAAAADEHGANSPVQLTCEYGPDVTPTTPEQVAAIPRILALNVAAATVAWNDQVLPAEVTTTYIKFQSAGFHYGLNRLTGEIRFHNPEGMKNWQEAKGRMVRSEVMGGRSYADAVERVSNSVPARDFNNREQVGLCSIAVSRKF